MTVSTNAVLLVLAAVAIVCALIGACYAVYDLWHAALGHRHDSDSHTPGGDKWIC